MNAMIGMRAILAVAVTGLAGCATNQSSDLEKELMMKEEKNKELMMKVEGLESGITERDSTIKTYEMRLAEGGHDPLLPPEAVAGECYARVWVPATYRTVSQEVLVKEASESVSVTPAQYEFVEETLLVSEASTRIEEVPAVYGTETERVMTRERQLVWRAAPNANAKPVSDELLATARAGGADLDSAQVGMCFHEHYKPAQYTTEQQEVLLAEASESVSVSEAQYRWVEKQVLVKEASTRLVEVPAQYDWVEERVVDKPAHTVWKKGTGPIQRIDAATGEIMCLVEVPATYKSIRKRVLTAPATTKTVEVPAEYETVRVRELVADASESRGEIPAKYGTVSIRKQVSGPSFVWHEIHNTDEPTETRTGAVVCLTEIPAQYETVTRRVVTSPASVRQVEVPAQYETVRVRKLVADATESRTEIPAEYKTVTYQELDKEGFMEWRSILCETNMTGTRISQVQAALRDAGFNPGRIDGVIGHETMAAVNAFQRSKGLPVDKYLNIETLKALGVATN